MCSGFTASCALVVVLLAALLAASPVSGQKALRVVPPKQNPHDRLQANLASVNQVSDSVTNLAQKIASSITSPDSKTEIFSPVSVAGALTLLLLGAGGRTEQELRRVMGFDEGEAKQIHYSFGRLFQDLVTNDPSLEALITWRVNDKCNQNDKDEEYEYDDYALEPMNVTADTSPSHLISVVNGMFLQTGLKPAGRFLSDIKQFYNSSVENLDFEHDPNGAATAVNEWCARETHGKIKEMVTGQTVSNSRMIIASALYFKAQWETTFSPYGTRPRPFYLHGRQEPPIDVHTMATTGCFPYYDASAQYDAKMIGLPYKTGNSTMYIILPNESTREKLQQLQSNLGAHQLNAMIDQMVTKKGMVMLPKMSISNTVQLSSVLQHLGVRDLFDPTRSNLTRMLDKALPQTATPKVTPGQQSNSTRLPAHPVTPRAKTQTLLVRAGNSVAPIKRFREKPSIKNSFKAVVRPRQQVGQSKSKQKSVSQEPWETQPYAQPNSTMLMSIDMDASVCSYVENCHYTKDNNCTCRRNGDATDCGALVANHVGDSHAKKCVFISGNEEIGRTFICIEQSNRLKNVQRVCEFQKCVFVGQQCYCCEQHVQSPTNVKNNRIPKMNVTSRLDIPKTCPTSKQDETIEPSDIQKRPKSEGNVQTQQPLFVNEVITQVKLDVNEQGTEGGAVTLVLIDRIGPSYTFQVDGPFLILIRHDITKALLFYGAVYDPRP